MVRAGSETRESCAEVSEMSVSRKEFKAAVSQLSAVQESSQHQRAVLSAELQASAALSPPERRGIILRNPLCASEAVLVE